MPSRFLVYGLVDPRTGELRYVGKSTYGLKRPKEHALPGKLKHSRSHCRNWVWGLVQAGLKPDVVVLEESTAEKLAEAEKHHIAYFKMLGADLTNITAGGDGGQLGMKFSDERKRRISEGHGGAMRKREDALRLYRDGLSTRAVALKLKLGNVTVYKWVRAAGINRPKKRA